MPEDTVKATPAPVAESGAGKSSGNISVEGLTAMLRQAPAKEPAEAAVAPVPETPAEAEKAPAEAIPEAEAKTEVEVKEAAPEAETPVEAAPEAETEDVLSHEDSGFDDETKARISKIVSKRLAKEKAKAAEKLTALEAQYAQAQAEAAAAKAKADELLQAVQSSQPVPTYEAGPDDPLGKVSTLPELQTAYNKAKTALRDAEELLDNGVPEEGIAIGNQTFTESDLKAIKRNAKRLLEDQIPAKAQYLQAKQAWSQTVAKEFAYLNDKNSAEYVRHQAAYNTMPGLRNYPNSDYIIGAVLAYEASKAKKAEPAKVAPAVKPKPPASPVAASAAPSGRTRETGDVGTRREVEAKKTAMLKKGNLTAKDAEAFFALHSR